MSIQTLNRELVESIRKQARSKSQDDKSRTYQQWLNHLSREYGHSWESLKNHVAELEQTELANLLAEEEERWGKRFLERVWGQIPHRDEHTLPIPLGDGASIGYWPSCFIGNHIFCPTSAAPHKMISGPVFSADGDLIEFHGEQLWNVSDQLVFMTLLLLSRELPTGAVLDFTWNDVERVAGKPAGALDTQFQQESFQRSLWRLAHGILVFERYDFKGPLLMFADVSKSPERFRVALHPDFSKFYYAPRKKVNSVEIKTEDGQRLPWSEKLTTYLAQREKRWAIFRLGEWMETLTDDELNALEICLTNDVEDKSAQTEAADILGVVLTAVAIETRKAKVEATLESIFEWRTIFLMVVVFEKLKRAGLIALPRPLSIMKEEIEVQLTEAGMASGLNMNDFLR